ncbi:MAG: 50S ribosomal protein L11 methyltransferase [Bacteroidia bacterium]|nr:50S ribosomal protein L11 methyltransferase [Bacteroidia bacterium]
MDYLEVCISLEPREPWADLLTVELASIGFESFLDTESGINAYIPAGLFSKERFDKMMGDYHPTFTFQVHISTIRGQNWNQEWENNFPPIHIGDELLVRAPFHPPGGNKFSEEIVIQPKMSFGTGHHATTCLMLQAILRIPLEGKAVADIGCGTGILGILAAKRGAGEILAVDIDAIAVENTSENAAMNGIFGIIVEKGGEDRLQGKSFHVILANINRNVLVIHMISYARALVQGGDLLLSGFFSTDAELLVAEGKKFGLKEMTRKEQSSWCMLHLRKES